MRVHKIELMILFIIVILILILVSQLRCTSRLAIPPTETDGIDLTVLIPSMHDDSLWEDGYQTGIKEGSKILPFSSFKDGFVGGLFFSFLGAGCVAGMQYFNPAIPDSSIMGTMSFRAGYLSGFKDATRKKKGCWALTGGIIGTGCNIACVVFTITWLKSHLD